MIAALVNFLRRLFVKEQPLQVEVENNQDTKNLDYYLAEHHANTNGHSC